MGLTAYHFVIGAIVLAVAFFVVEKLVRTWRKKSAKGGQGQATEGLHRPINDYLGKGLVCVFDQNELAKLGNHGNRQAAVLNYFASSLFDKDTLEAVLWDIAENCISQLGLEDCVIYTLDPDRKVLEQKAAYGRKDLGGRQLLSPLEIKVGEGIVGGVAQTGQPRLLADTSTEAQYIVDDKKRYSELAVPIMSSGKLLGVLDSEHSAKGFFTESHLLIFQLIAKLTAIKLERIGVQNPKPLINGTVYYKELTRLLAQEKMYREANLSLGAMADMLDISGTYLSQLVNKLGGQNFSDHINSYRVIEAKDMLTDPKYEDYTILSIGLEAGFNSKSTFYSAFKKHTGVTPTQFRKGYWKAEMTLA
ncbi:helix-turn-helix domain-containing protein [Pseudozobellia thermophila]|uniref:AraC-type DNA-binding protein n=1 Tax=Pseudozobellia thermophila TaxID=192903 RepID=A0A1M6BTN9_9FLAO|nr:helix-turn-helix domain-containing protein [Pseudozobellia thermophila]SHI52106.1 AraC-type DNA-binding protein [Pseudozobellia thermophila]